MKGRVFLWISLIALAIPTQAQITQAASDSIVIHRMSTESRLYTIFSKDLQTEGTTITTSAGELLELDYPLWIYFIRYDDQADETPVARRYLVVKNSDGNVLTVNTTNDVSPPDLETWRKVPADLEEPLDSLVLIAKGNLSGDEGIPKQNLAITSETEWENLKTAMNLVNNVTDSFRETTIDFSRYQIIALFDEVKFNDGWTIDIADIAEHKNGIVVTIQNLAKGDSISVMTQPYHIVKMPIFDKNVIFHNEGYRELGCEIEDFYYYNRDEKIFISYPFSNDYLLVGFMPQVQDTEIVNYINQTGLFNPVEASNIIEHARNNDEYHLIFVNTNESKTCSQLKEIIFILENNPIVAFADFSFYIENHYMNYTDILSYAYYFNVKVKDKDDLSDLYDVVQETNTWIEEQDPYMPQWFTIRANKYSKGNALRMGNYFYETGKFEAAQWGMEVYTRVYPK